MLCKILKREKVDGRRFEPGDIAELPPGMVERLEEMGVARRVGANAGYEVNIDAAGPLANLPAGSRLIAKLPEGE